MPAAPATKCLGEPTAAEEAIALFPSMPASCGALLTFLIEHADARVRRLNGLPPLGQTFPHTSEQQSVQSSVRDLLIECSQCGVQLPEPAVLAIINVSSFRD